MFTIRNSFIIAGLLIGLTAGYGCDSVDDGPAPVAAEHEQDQITDQEKHMIVVDEEFTEDPEVVLELDLVAAPRVSEGAWCCYAACYEGEPGYYPLPWVKVNCTDSAKAFCASQGWSFKDAMWAPC